MFNWPIGKDKLLLISIGTGRRQPKLDAEKAQGMAPLS
jgi:hypothetical protein